MISQLGMCVSSKMSHDKAENAHLQGVLQMTH
jgi:hypothetical protein